MDLARLTRAFLLSAGVVMLELVALTPASLAASPHLLGLGVPVAVADAYGTPAQTSLIIAAPGSWLTTSTSSAPSSRPDSRATQAMET